MMTLQLPLSSNWSQLESASQERIFGPGPTAVRLSRAREKTKIMRAAGLLREKG
jgi:hypothetical protein